jgi:hypothetical protein
MLTGVTSYFSANARLMFFLDFAPIGLLKGEGGARRDIASRLRSVTARVGRAKSRGGS